MGSKTAPAPQDFTGAAEKMGLASQQVIGQQTAANRPTQIGPQGTVSWQNQGGGYDWSSFGGLGSAGYEAASNAAFWNSDLGKQMSANGASPEQIEAAYRPWSTSQAGQDAVARAAGLQKSPDQWTETTTLNPQAQAAYDAQQALTTSRSQTGLNLFNQQAQQIQQPLDMGGLNSWGQAPQAGQIQNQLQQTQLQHGVAQPNVQGSVGLQQNLAQSPLQQSVNLQQSINQPGVQGNVNLQNNLGLQRAFDFGGAQQMMSPTVANQQGYNAAMDLSNRALDRQWGQQKEAFDADLAAQGLKVGDAAYDRAYSNFNAARNDAYRAAQDQATLTGAQLGNQLFGQSLQGRQQGVNEAMAQGQFGNQAAIEQGQFGNQAALAQGQFANQAAAQQFGQGLQAGQFANQSALAQGQFANQAAGQQFGQGLQSGQFFNQAALAGGQFANQAAAQQFGQGLQAGQFANAAAAQQFNQGAQSAAFANQAQQQAYGQGMQSAQYANQLRQAQLAEQMQQRGFSLNQVQALLAGQQVGIPQGPQFSATAGAAQPTNYLGAAQMQQQANLSTWQAQNQAWSDMFNGVANLGKGAFAFA